MPDTCDLIDEAIADGVTSFEELGDILQISRGAAFRRREGVALTVAEVRTILRSNATELADRVIAHITRGTSYVVVDLPRDLDPRRDGDVDLTASSANCHRVLADIADAMRDFHAGDKAAVEGMRDRWQSITQMAVAAARQCDQLIAAGQYRKQARRGGEAVLR